MKKIRAFYYKENYYCFLPGEDLTVEELRASLGGKGIRMNVTRLSRKNCLPPYFVTGQQETVTVRLKPWHMYPVTAYLLSRKEYDARLLKKVEKICPGCLHYGGDGTQLEEHCYLEMGLDGSCPYRQEQRRTRPCESWWTRRSTTRRRSWCARPSGRIWGRWPAAGWSWPSTASGMP